MTYCVAISVDAGIVSCSDSLTSAGIDQVATYSKMFRFGVEGEKQFVIMGAGNLATTQATIARIGNDIRQQTATNLLTMQSIEDAADYLGEVSREQQEKRNIEGRNFEASFIIGGQIRGSEHRTILVYPEGNYITTSADTPYLQIGESKYGKPILDRILTHDLSLESCATCALVSMDSTMRSNLGVGPPIELQIYQANSLRLAEPYRFEADSRFLRDLKRQWEEQLKLAFRQMPPLSWSTRWDESGRERNEVS